MIYKMNFIVSNILCTSTNKYNFRSWHVQFLAHTLIINIDALSKEQRFNIHVGYFAHLVSGQACLDNFSSGVYWALLSYLAYAL